MARFRTLILFPDKALEILSKGFIYKHTWGMIAPFFTVYRLAIKHMLKIIRTNPIELPKELNT